MTPRSCLTTTETQRLPEKQQGMLFPLPRSYNSSSEPRTRPKQNTSLGSILFPRARSEIHKADGVKEKLSSSQVQSCDPRLSPLIWRRKQSLERSLGSYGQEKATSSSRRNSWQS